MYFANLESKESEGILKLASIQMLIRADSLA